MLPFVLWTIELSKANDYMLENIYEYLKKLVALIAYIPIYRLIDLICFD